MKATINNIEVEGTPQEIAELIREFGYNYEYTEDVQPWHIVCSGTVLDKNSWIRKDLL